MNCGLRTLKREAKSALMFVSDGGAPFTVTGLAKLIARAGDGLEPARAVHMGGGWPRPKRQDLPARRSADHDTPERCHG